MLVTKVFATEENVTISPEQSRTKSSQSEQPNMKVYMKQKRGTHSETQNSDSKKKKTQYMKEYIKQKWTSETQNTESKNKKAQYMKELKKVQKCSKSTSIQNLISKFQDIVLQGPLYICICCDQLW